MSQARIARLETLLGRIQANRGSARTSGGMHASPPPPPAAPYEAAAFDAALDDAGLDDAHDLSHVDAAAEHADTSHAQTAPGEMSPIEMAAAMAARPRLQTPLEQVIETASGAAAPTDEAVTSPGTRRAPVGPPIDDLSPAAALLDRVRTEPEPEKRADAPREPLAAEPIRAASVAPPSSPIAAASGEQAMTGRSTFGDLLDRALRLRPR